MEKAAIEEIQKLCSTENKMSNQNRPKKTKKKTQQIINNKKEPKHTHTHQTASLKPINKLKKSFSKNPLRLLNDSFFFPTAFSLSFMWKGKNNKI